MTLTESGRHAGGENGHLVADLKNMQQVSVSGEVSPLAVESLSPPKRELKQPALLA